MKIDEAIEILEALAKHKGSWESKRTHDAIHLGLEALKRLKGNRSGFGSWDTGLLPGETE